MLSHQDPSAHALPEVVVDHASSSLFLLHTHACTHACASFLVSGVLAMEDKASGPSDGNRPCLLYPQDSFASHLYLLQEMLRQAVFDNAFHFYSSTARLRLSWLPKADG